MPRKHRALAGALSLVFLALSVPAAAEAAVPSWAGTGAMTDARWRHTSTLLPNGKVLVVGGENGASTLATAERYDPATAAWTTAGSMIEARTRATATLLNDGKVLVAGGVFDPNGAPVYRSTAQLYDYTSNTWATTAGMATARSNATATRLNDGKVLVAGGLGTGGVVLNSAEIYDPNAGGPGVGGWSTVPGGMASTRFNATATLLTTGPNTGKVLIAGGYNGAVLNTAELYDPTGDTFTSTLPMTYAATSAAAVTLADGRVLVTGGYGTNIAGTQIYDPVLGTWAAGGTMVGGRAEHTATRLTDNRVLVTGGFTSGSLSSTEVSNATGTTWSSAVSMSTTRTGHTAELLSSDKVLVAGGASPPPSPPTALASAELGTYDVTAPVLTGPTMSPEHTAGFTNDQTPTFTWSTDAPSSATCQIDDLPLAGTACSNAGFTPGANLTEGSHTFTVSATDPSGNVSNELSKTFTVDITAPTFSYGALSPQHGLSDDATNQNSTSFSIANGEPLDGAGRSCALDVGVASACNGAFSAAGLIAGEHTVDVSGTDRAGNPGTGQHKFFVDLADPNLPTISVTPPLLDNDNTPTFDFSATDPAPSSAQAPYGALTYECKIEDQGGPTVAYQDCSVTPFTFPTVDDGFKRFFVRATDPSGRTGPAKTYDWTLDTIPPVAHVSTPWVNGRFSYFEGVPSDYYCTDNVTGVVNCDGPVPDGQDVPHSRPGGNPEVDTKDFAVFVMDGAGNQTTYHTPYRTMTFQQMVREDDPMAYFRLDDADGSPFMADFGSHLKGGEWKNRTASEPAGISGDNDSARHLLGADGYGYANGIAAPHGATTMIAWVRFDDIRDSQILDHGDDNAIYLENDRFVYRHMGTLVRDARVGPTFDVAVDTWYMVVARWTGGQMQLFVTPYDPARPKSGPFLAATGFSGRQPTASSTFYIGYGQDKPWLKGYVDEVSYFNTALSDLHLLELWYADPPARGQRAAAASPAAAAAATPAAATPAASAPVTTQSKPKPKAKAKVRVASLTRRLANAQAHLRALKRHHAKKQQLAAAKRSVASLKRQLAAAKRRA